MVPFLTVFTAAAMAGDPSLSGHAGVVVPLASVAGGGDVSTVANGFAFGVPIGFGKAVSNRTTIDFEFVPLMAGGNVELIVHPGVVFGLGKGYGAGVRAAFEVVSNAAGATLILNKGVPMGDTNAFVEAVVPLRARSDNGVTRTSAALAVHLGVGF